MTGSGSFTGTSRVVVLVVRGGSSKDMEGRDVLFINGDLLEGSVLVIGVEEGDKTKGPMEDELWVMEVWW